jgi:hypothetical protein
MNRMSVLAVSVSAAVLVGAAPAAKKAAGSAPPPPIATYWMDVATQSGMGMGMSAGAQPDMSQIMSMMSGGGGGVMHSLDLRLASRDKPAGAPQADHLIPPGLKMGASLPLITPAATKPDTVPTEWGGPMPQPKGRMLIYWGCGEHVGAGQPMVIDYSRMAAGKIPPGMAALASMARVVSAPNSAPGFGRWPNDKDNREVPAAGSLLGAHKIAANYAPQIDFSLGAGQDFMPGLGLREAGNLPSGASRLAWQPAAVATGYALAMFGSNEAGDVIMWSSAKSASMATLDYLAPAEVKRLIAAGAVLPPSTNECVLPAEVAAASPMGMVTMIGYGPEAYFAEAPKAPKWTTKVRFKSTASLMRGMGAMMGGASGGDDGARARQQAADQQQQQQPKKKKRGFGLGDLIGGALPIPH